MKVFDATEFWQRERMILHYRDHNLFLISWFWTGYHAKNGTDTRYIQELLDHNSSLTAEIYAHVSNRNIQ